MKYYFKCPNCENDEGFSVPSEKSYGLGCLLVILGHFLAALLYADAKRHRVQCAQCGYIFRQPSLPRSSVSILAMWVIGIVLVFVLLVCCMMAYPDLTTMVPEHWLISELDKIVADNPRAVTLGLIPMICFLLVASFIASWISNIKVHRQLRKKYKIRPTSYSEAKNEISARSPAVQNATANEE